MRTLSFIAFFILQSLALSADELTSVKESEVRWLNCNSLDTSSSTQIYISGPVTVKLTNLPPLPGFDGYRNLVGAAITVTFYKNGIKTYEEFNSFRGVLRTAKNNIHMSLEARDSARESLTFQGAVQGLTATLNSNPKDTDLLFIKEGGLFSSYALNCAISVSL
ncbi:MAG: hypothetical protein COT74_08950 [Bdellovibrionales bacterium CG10_big_fil_rev_8_21_14_0_10_45_34]|nr:MAG: hypothetical protein COT74_08950 [Bdellovibrionales bacterium CG10_big_fil_rev_8_21_14_0_10_45_34]